MNICVTGATGFVGRELCEALRTAGHRVSTAERNKKTLTVDSIGDVYSGTELVGSDVVVHLAARVHVMHDSAVDPLSEFRLANVATTLTLANKAAASGVRRFIFISSVKVNGEVTVPGCAFRADGTPAPQDPYGISKMEAELGLRAIATQTGMEVVIIRPPLVYGPGVKANFASMVQWVRRGVPLPLGAIDNRRSLVAVQNLVDLIRCCIDHPAASNQTFLVSDGEDVSTTELLRKVASAFGRPARLLPVPQRVLEWGLGLLGRQPLAQRLFSSLQLDIGSTREVLGWRPPLSMDEGLALMARHFAGK